jgi:hypothetical protein
MATGKDTRLDVRVFPAGDPNPGDVRVRSGEVTWSDVFLTTTVGADVVVDPGGSIVAPVAASGGSPVELAATSAGTSLDSAALVVGRSLSATSAGTSTTVASLTVGRSLRAVSTGASADLAELSVDSRPQWSPAISTPGVGDIAALQFMLRDAAQEEELAAAYVAALVLL